VEMRSFIQNNASLFQRMDAVEHKQQITDQKVNDLFLAMDEGKLNEQYPPIEVRQFTKAHDRFLIIDGKAVYHIGASLKDLGKKWFAFSKFGKEALRLLERVERRQEAI